MADAPTKDKTFGFEYQYGDEKYVLHIVAHNQFEAHLRLRACYLYGQCVGELVTSIPVPAGGLLVRLLRTLGVKV